MRGLAVLTAVAGAWILAGGSFPTVRVRAPDMSLATIVQAATAGIVGFVVAFGLLGTLVPSLALGLLALGIPMQIAGSRRRRAQAGVAALWPDLLAHIRSSVSAGSTLPDAYLDAAERTGGTFAVDLDDVRTDLIFGPGFAAAMGRVRGHFDDPIADRVTTTLTVANETGGSRVGDVLAALSVSIAAETRLRAAHDAALTEQRWTAGVALAAPWVILALSIATNPQASLAFSTTEGAVVVGIGFTLTVVGFILSRRLATLSRPPRLLR